MTKTRIIALMFHRVNDPYSGCHPDQFAQYLDYLVKHFPIVVPGELAHEAVAICLTFDDAYYDFYHHVYPLLKQYQIKALLAVPVKYIVNDTALSAETRLSTPYPQGMEGLTYQRKVAFCTWQELREMAASGHVMIASHGFAHVAHTDKNVNLTQEIFESKQRLEDELNLTVKYFVYPFGKMTRQSHKLVRQVYDYGIRIGSALNLGWKHSGQLIYRIDATPLWTQQQPIGKKLIYQTTLKYWRNRIRAL
ncbi:MAG: polysaccharide deacetylase family protein [Candidatus Berkiellales bacterium]